MQLNQLALAVVAHVLNELGGPLDEVALAGLELAIDQLVESDLDLDETGHLDGAGSHGVERMASSFTSSLIMGAPFSTEVV